MSPFILFNIQTTFSLLLFALIAKWYVTPWVAGKTRREALVPLLFVHAFRYTPLTLLVPGQVSTAVPAAPAEAIAYGDLLSAILALAALVLVRSGSRLASPAVWLFSVIGILDIALAIGIGLIHALFQYPLGFNWYILNFYVPALIVTHVLIIRCQLKAD